MESSEPSITIFQISTEGLQVQDTISRLMAERNEARKTNAMLNEENEELRA